MDRRSFNDPSLAVLIMIMITIFKSSLSPNIIFIYFFTFYIKITILIDLLFIILNLQKFNEYLLDEILKVFFFLYEIGYLSCVEQIVDVLQKGVLHNMTLS